MVYYAWPNPKAKQSFQMDGPSSAATYTAVFLTINGGVGLMVDCCASTTQNKFKVPSGERLRVLGSVVAACREASRGRDTALLAGDVSGGNTAVVVTSGMLGRGTGTGTREKTGWALWDACSTLT